MYSIKKNMVGYMCTNIHYIMASFPIKITIYPPFTHQRLVGNDGKLLAEPITVGLVGSL